MIFIDRSIPKGVAEALKQVRGDIRWLEDEFPHDVKDPEWLREVGHREWIVVARDKKIRTRPGERQAIIDNSVGCFYFTQKQPLNRWEYLKLLCLTIDEMERKFAETRRPFIYGVGKTGFMTRVL